MATVQDFLSLLDLPGAYTRGLLAGRGPNFLGSSSLGEALQSWRPADGSDVAYELFGARNDPSTWDGTDILSTLIEMVADPINLTAAGGLRGLHRAAGARSVARTEEMANLARKLQQTNFTPSGERRALMSDIVAAGVGQQTLPPELAKRVLAHPLEAWQDAKASQLMADEPLMMPPLSDPKVPGMSLTGTPLRDLRDRSLLNSLADRAMGHGNLPVEQSVFDALLESVDITNPTQSVKSLRAINPDIPGILGRMATEDLGYNPMVRGTNPALIDAVNQIDDMVGTPRLRQMLEIKSTARGVDDKLAELLSFADELATRPHYVLPQGGVATGDFIGRTAMGTPNVKVPRSGGYTDAQRASLARGMQQSLQNKLGIPDIPVSPASVKTPMEQFGVGWELKPETVGVQPLGTKGVLRPEIAYDPGMMGARGTFTVPSSPADVVFVDNVIADSALPRVAGTADNLIDALLDGVVPQGVTPGRAAAGMSAWPILAQLLRDRGGRYEPRTWGLQ